MTSVRVIVDDEVQEESTLRFTGEWRKGGIDAEFNKTTHLTLTEGASNTLHFDGTSVQLVATLLDGMGILNLSYTIDSGAPKTLQREEGVSKGFHSTFLQEDVPDGQHTLTTTLDDEGITLCVDYFLYTTTLERIVELQKPVTVLVDDTDPSITYSASWAATNTQETALGHTEHITSSAGSNATFTFYGTYVGVFGTSSDTASAIYTIDGGTPIGFEKSGKLLFDQSLNDGAHNLVITLRNEAEFSLDYITYTPSLSEAVYNSPLPSGSATTLLAPPSATASNTSSTNVGAIAGGVSGGVVAIFVIVLVATCFYRNKWRKAENHPLSYLASRPFDKHLEAHGTDMSQEFHPSMLYSHNSPFGVPLSAVPREIGSVSGGQQQAQDGGVRVLANVDDGALSPPAYRPNYPTNRVKI